MQNNNQYFTANGKYSPKNSEKIREQRKLAAVGYQQSLIKGKENTTIGKDKGNIKGNSGTIMDRVATVNGVLMSFEDIWFAILAEYQKECN